MSAHVAPRGADRAAGRAFRPTRAVPAALVAALLAAGGALAVVEMIAALAGGSGYLFPPGRAAETNWNDPVVIALAAALTLLGSACVLLGLRPGRPALIALRTDERNLVLGVTRHGLRRSLAAAAGDAPGVTRVRGARLRGGRAVIEVEGDPDRADVADAVRARLAALGVRQEIEPVVRVS